MKYQHVGKERKRENESEGRENVSRERRVVSATNESQLMKGGSQSDVIYLGGSVLPSRVLLLV